MLAVIANELQAQPVVPRRAYQAENHTVREGRLYCAGDLPMVHKGKMTAHRGYTYRQYVCPLHWRKSLQQKFLACPAFHPKYFDQKGCNVLIRLEPSVRSQIPSGTEEFQNLYHKRTAVERSYARLLTLTLEHPMVRGLNATRNHCTIAHIAPCWSLWPLPVWVNPTRSGRSEASFPLCEKTYFVKAYCSGLALASLALIIWW